MYLINEKRPNVKSRDSIMLKDGRLINFIEELYG